MSFKNLQQRYDERSKELYRGATYKFDGGKASRGANDDPLIVRKPGDGYFGGASRLLGRFLPASSAAEDVKRITLFTLSTRGIAFLAKQALLQTGNTFAKTRVLNPTFAVANAIPFLHVQRNLDVSNPAAAIKGALGITAIQDLISRPEPLSGDALRRAGQLQLETYNNLLPPESRVLGGFVDKIPFVSQLKGVVSAARGQDIGRPEIGGQPKDYFVGRLTRQPVTEETSQAEAQSRSFLQKAGDFLKRKTLGEAKPGTFKYGGKVTVDGFTGPRYGAITPKDWDGVYTTYMRLGGQSDYLVTANTYPQSTNISARSDTLSTVAKETLPITPIGTDNFLFDTAVTYADKWNVELGKDRRSDIKFLEYFSSGEGAVKSNNSATNASEIAKGVRQLAGETGQFKKISYITDPLNYPLQTNKNRLQPYATLPAPVDGTDSIIVSFAMSKDDPVQFRAFISELNESTAPQYKSYQYIGRIEKFISYSSVQRNLSFKLELVSFSKDELQTMWRRVNFLTGLAFPYGINKGLLQPNIMKVTIGNLYKDQPAYIQNISSNFADVSWDIEDGVPMRATVNMQLVLIEKRTALADSPFYSITESDGVFVTNRTPSVVPSEQPNTTTETTEDGPATETPPPSTVTPQSRTPPPAPSNDAALRSRLRAAGLRL
jgi:hypothetical protein